MTSVAIRMGRRGPTPPNLYEVLQVSATATPADIRAAYRRRALICHPDKGGATESFQILVRAFETLGDQAARAKYDLKRLHAGAKEPAQEEAVRRKKRGRDEPGREGTNQQAAPTQAESTATQAQQCALRVRILLERLRLALQEVSAEERKMMIGGLPTHIRALLLDFMVDRARQAAPTEPTASAADAGSGGRPQHHGPGALLQGAASDSDDSLSSSDTGSETEARAMRALTFDGGAEDTSAPRRRPDGHARPTKPKGVHQRKSGNTCLYSARLVFCNVEIRTRYQSRLEIAVDHHILLMRIRQLASEGAPLKLDDSCGDRIVKACDDALQEAGVTAGEIGLRALARVTLWGNGNVNHFDIRTPSLPVADCVVWRRRLITAKYQDWPSFRSVWRELQQHPQWHPRRGHTVRDLDALDERMESAWPMLKRPRGSARTRSAPDVPKAVWRLQRGLAAKAAAEAREARQAARQAARLEVERCRRRRRWLYRKAGKDMTMEDLLHSGSGDPGSRGH